MDMLGMDMHNMSMENCSTNPMMSMQMYFFFGRQCSLLFSSFNLETPGQIFGGVLLIMVVAILYEGLKTFREILVYYESKKADSKGDHAIQDTAKESQQTSRDTTPLIKNGRQSKCAILIREYCSLFHVLQSFLHVVQVGVAYLLMLVAMTYNGWLFLAVCIGAGLGYFIFGKCRKSLDNFKAQSEHCH